MEPHADRPIRVGVRTRSLAPDRLEYLRQLGVTDVFLDHGDTDEEPDEFNDREAGRTLTVGSDSIPTTEELRETKAHVESFGLTFAGVHSIPYSLYGDIMFDRAGREDAIEQIKTLIRNLGAAGIPILGYQWNPRGVVPMRTGETQLRGNAAGTAFDLDQVADTQELPAELDRAYTEAECWEYYEGFISEVIPVAEDAGVRLALHPADPPSLPSLGGIPRLFRDVESFERALAIVDSEAHGLKLCLGCFSEMGVDVESVIRRFGSAIVFLHVRDVEGTVPDFHETFVDEGNYSVPAVIRTLRNVGFDGALLPDHVPAMSGDTDWRHRSRGFTVGYLRGAIDAVRGEEPSQKL